MVSGSNFWISFFFEIGFLSADFTLCMFFLLATELFPLTCELVL